MSKKQPEALRLAEMLTADEWPGNVTLVSYARECVAELRRLHAYCQELESQVIRDCVTHAQNPTENEHVADDVSKNGVELNMSQPAPAAVAGPSGAVAYLDIGTGGYLDLGTDLADEALSRLPKGRHALVIAGAYGIDGYVAAPQPSPTAQAADSVLEDAARWHWMADYIVGTRTDLDDELIACPTVDELRKLVDADLAARKQGGA